MTTNIKITTALDIIRDSEILFYQTGSRLFFPSYCNRNSDWDFFVENTTEVKEFLESNHFKLNDISNYLDKELTWVYTLDNVDIQLRKDVNLWLNKQSKLMNLPQLTRKLILDPSKTREELSDIWNSL